MKKRVGIVDKDNSFPERFSKIIKARHEDVEVLLFPDLKSAKTAADKSLLDLLLIDNVTYTNHSEKDSIPTSCKVAIMTNDKNGTCDESLPVVCKYKSVEEWYSVICGFCVSDEPGTVKGGVNGISDTKQSAVCLFLPGNGGTCATLAATAFCRFLSENGFERTAAFEPYFESGEDVWRVVELVSKNNGFVTLCMNNWDNDSVVIPALNSKQIVLVSDGTHVANDNIRKLLRDLPDITGESKNGILGKTALLYNGFSPEDGELIKNSEITKLGGLDSKRNMQAAFEKLVIMCTRK